jgi:hypothetical protein
MKLLVFGKSPFINTVDIDYLIGKYHTAGINDLCCLHAFNYGFFYDYVFNNLQCKKVICTWWNDYPNCEKVYPVESCEEIETIFKEKEYQDGYLKLGFRLYTVSMVLNWALLNGYKEVYLIGIDHDEVDGEYQTFNGVGGSPRTKADNHKRLKKYVTMYHDRGLLKVYQCNPNQVKKWQLPYKDVKEL